MEAQETAARTTTAVRIEPDLDFIRSLEARSGESFKKCMQCGTCSATCLISPDEDPFPAKEMAWASWGMKDRLLADPDVWLCYNCNDCSARCPRGARPGDILAAVRQEVVTGCSPPRFLGRVVNEPAFLPVLLAVPALLLGAALWLRDPIRDALGISGLAGGKIVFSYSPAFPHWLLNGFFAFFGALALLAVVAGIIRFWRAMNRGSGAAGPPARGIWPSIGAALKRVFMHEKFPECTTASARYLSHVLVFFGFLALSVVTVWVITARVNPLIRGEFTYPFNFWSPWKLLANAGGAALVLGCVMMIRDRFIYRANINRGSYTDWSLVWTLLAVGVTGFATEALHYLRMEPHRHVVYFIHLVFVFALLIYLPWSKLAHVFYRTAALVFVERSGRSQARPGSNGDSK
jgi:quinone-modifying oxidoreductase subunit QmoC